MKYIRKSFFLFWLIAVMLFGTVSASAASAKPETPAASIGSLKGPRHGGANLKVQNMFADLKSHVDQDHWDNEDEIITYLKKVLNKEAFDHAGLIYGMGHAVYTLSDPREVILKRFAQALAEEKGMTESAGKRLSQRKV